MKTIRSSSLQFFVPLEDLRAGLHRVVKAALDGVRGARLQDGQFHITAAFINGEVEIVKAGKLAEVIDGEHSGMVAQVLALDTRRPSRRKEEGCISFFCQHPECPIVRVSRLKAASVLNPNSLPRFSN